MDKNENRPREPPSSYRRTLGHPGFLLIWLSQTVSQSGDYIFEVAVFWIVLESTGSVLDVGILTAATVIPLVVASPLLGVYADRWDLRKLLIASYLIQGLVTAVIVPFAYAKVPYLFPIVLVAVLTLGTAQTAVRLATRAAIPRLVPTSDLAPANALLFLSANANQIVGYGIGGVVIAVAGVLPSIGYDALTYLVAAALISMLVSTTLVLAAPVGGPGTKSPGAAYKESAVFVRNHRWLLEIVLFALAINFFSNGLTALSAPYVQIVLRGGSTDFGLFLLSFAIGGTVGAFVIGRLRFRSHAGLIQLFCVLGMGVAVLGLGWVSVLPAAIAFGAMFGLFLDVGNVVIGSLNQARVPKEMMGRVSSFTSLAAASGPFGAIAFGFIGTVASVPAALLIAGVSIIAWSLVGFGFFSSLRQAAY